MDTFNEVWDVICDYLKSKNEDGKKAISDVAYNAWIKTIEPVGLDFEKSYIVLSVPNKLNKTVIENSYIEILKIASEEVFGKKFDFLIEVAGDDTTKETLQKISRTPEEDTDNSYNSLFSFVLFQC